MRQVPSRERAAATKSIVTERNEMNDALSTARSPCNASHKSEASEPGTPRAIVPARPLRQRKIPKRCFHRVGDREQPDTPPIEDIDLVFARESKTPDRLLLSCPPTVLLNAHGCRTWQAQEDRGDRVRRMWQISPRKTKTVRRKGLL